MRRRRRRQQQQPPLTGCLRGPGSQTGRCRHHSRTPRRSGPGIPRMRCPQACFPPLLQLQLPLLLQFWSTLLPLPRPALLLAKRFPLRRPRWRHARLPLLRRLLRRSTGGGSADVRPTSCCRSLRLPLLHPLLLRTSAGSLCPPALSAGSCPPATAPGAAPAAASAAAPRCLPPQQTAAQAGGEGGAQQPAARHRSCERRRCGQQACVNQSAGCCCQPGTAGPPSGCRHACSPRKTAPRCRPAGRARGAIVGAGGMAGGGGFLVAVVPPVRESSTTKDRKGKEQHQGGRKHPGPTWFAPMVMVSSCTQAPQAASRCARSMVQMLRVGHSCSQQSCGGDSRQ